MKIVAEIVTAIALLALGAFFTPKAVESFKKEALTKVQEGLPSLQTFSKELTRK